MSNIEKLIRAYHLIVEKEASIIAGSNIREGEWYSVNDPRYYLERDELKKFLRSQNFGDPDKIIEDLIKQGFLIYLSDNFRSAETNKLRSLHMDVLVRSSQITTQHGRPPYILSCKFTIKKSRIPFREDRKIIPNETSDDVSKSLWNTIFSFFNGRADLANTYISIMKDYLKNSGLDAYQAGVLRKILLSEKNTHAIIAPTGAGKTEIYLFYLLATLMKLRILEKDERKALLIYPRRSLALDQAYRLIKLLSIANDRLKKYNSILTFAIRDGDTLRHLKDAKGSFRGIICPHCEKGPLVYGKGGEIVCDGCKKEYRFIKTIRGETGKADIIATNPWALEIRLIDSALGDVDIKALSNLHLMLFDEAHEYRGLSGGILGSCILDIIKENNPNLKLVFSSATIPNARSFISKLSGDSNCEIYNFEDIIDLIGNGISGEKLVILSYLTINPNYSWNTYCQLWAVFMAFIAYAYKRRELKQPQSLVFINNIRELRRAHSGYIENIRLGEPKDHLSDGIESRDPYCYWHYLPSEQREEVYQSARSRKLYEELEKKVYEMHSQLPREEREEVIRRLRQEDGLVVFSTSSLELGVDYDGVSFILNSGLDNPISLIQRIGRGGRNYKTLNTVLGLILIRAIPTEILRIYDQNFIRALSEMSSEDYSLFVTRDNPQILKRAMLIESLSKLAMKGLPTYASKGSKGPIKDLDTLQSLIKDIVEEIVNEEE
uniref:DEAD/DEAH box helicase n=1 Tax=Geoglobus ahangari TaxID=113653 RepID=A0A7C4S9E0_9EURY